MEAISIRLKRFQPHPDDRFHSAGQRASLARAASHPIRDNTACALCRYTEDNKSSFLFNENPFHESINDRLTSEGDWDNLGYFLNLSIDLLYSFGG